MEYLGEFEFIFETVLGYVSGVEAKKNGSRKYHAWAPLTESGPFKGTVYLNRVSICCVICRQTSFWGALC